MKWLLFFLMGCGSIVGRYQITRTYDHQRENLTAEKGILTVSDTLISINGYEHHVKRKGCNSKVCVWRSSLFKFVLIRNKTLMIWYDPQKINLSLMRSGKDRIEPKLMATYNLM